MDWNIFDISSFKDVISTIISISMLVAILAVPVIGGYFFGKSQRKRYNIPSRHFWTAFIFLTPVIVAPIVFFVSLFMDHVNRPEYTTLAFILINTYAFWLIAGYVLSLKLLVKSPNYTSLLPSLLSWICAFGALWGGLALLG